MAGIVAGASLASPAWGATGRKEPAAGKAPQHSSSAKKRAGKDRPAVPAKDKAKAAAKKLVEAGLLQDEEAVHGEEGVALLFDSIAQGKPKNARVALLAGVDKEAKDAEGRTALAVAMGRMDPDCIRVLLEAGASPASIPAKTLAYCIQSPVSSRVQALYGKSPREVGSEISPEEWKKIAARCEKDCADTFNQLLPYAASLQQNEQMKELPWDCLSYHSSAEGAACVERLRLLQRMGIDITDSGADTPMIVLAARGYAQPPVAAKAMEVLLEAGADVHTVHEGKSLVAIAAGSHDDASLVEVLVKAGASPKEHGLVYLAAVGGNPSVLRKLVEWGNDVNEVCRNESQQEETPLQAVLRKKKGAGWMKDTYEECETILRAAGAKE